MYQPDTGPCDIYTKSSEPAAGWVGSAAADINTAVATADAGWNSILYPAWQSFVSLGPQAALQAMNPPYTSSAGGGQAAGAPGASGSPTGGVPGAGPGTVVQKNGLTADQNQFLAVFGQYRPFKTFTGPLPAPGTSGSLVYGGSVFNRPASGARVVSSPASTAGPGATQGSAAAQAGSLPGSSSVGISTLAPSGSCPTFAGVNALPWGESAVSASAGSNSAASSTGWELAALAVLGILGAAYLMSEDDKRKGRS